jgi:hypothetical protein
MMLKVVKIFWPLFIAYCIVWAFISALSGDGFTLLVFAACLIFGVYMADRAINHGKY